MPPPAVSRSAFSMAQVSEENHSRGCRWEQAHRQEVRLRLCVRKAAGPKLRLRAQKWDNRMRRGSRLGSSFARWWAVHLQQNGCLTC